MASLTPRGKALRRLSTHRGIKEDPAGSNSDHRPNKARYGDARWGIRKAQMALASWLVELAWCGTWAAWALAAAGVKGVNPRLASVALIEDDARAHRAPFFDWLPPSAWKQVLRGDLVVLFGRGVHTGVVRGFKVISGQVYVITDEGNTSSGTSGSQSNGGMSARRVRALSDVHGFARVDYPGGKVRGMVDRTLAAFDVRGDEPEPVTRAQERDMPQSDRILLNQLRLVDSTQASDLAVAIGRAM